MLVGYWSLLILNAVGACGLAVGVIALLHRAGRQRNVERF
jgi:hypothetical protein